MAVVPDVFVRKLRATDARGETRRDVPARVVVGIGIGVAAARATDCVGRGDDVTRPLRADTRRVFVATGIGVVFTTAFMGLVLCALASPGFKVCRIWLFKYGYI